jgi:aminopeptidase YwaD
MGYGVSTETVVRDDGESTQNVVATGVWGTRPDCPLVIIGAHYDSKGGPGADDNATGVAVILETARCLAVAGLPDVEARFVAFGNEEMRDDVYEHHHYGSRYHATHLSDADRKRLVGMVNVDTVGSGDTFQVDNMREASNAFAEFFCRVAEANGSHPRNTPTKDWSDHEAFEKKGIPVAYFHWTTCPVMHTADDTVGRVDASCVAAAGTTLLSGLWRLREYQGYVDVVALLRRGSAAP